MRNVIVATAIALSILSGCQGAPTGTQQPGTTGTQPGDTRVDSDPSLGVIRGVLKGKDGKPAANVLVRAYKTKATSSSYRVSAAEDASGSATGSFPVGEPTPAPTPTPAPVPTADPGTSEVAALSQATTEADGAFVIPNVPTGEVTVEAIKSDSEKAIVMNVVVVAGNEVKLDGISLADTGAITGRLTTNRAGADLFGADVFVPGTSFAAKADEDGKFIIMYVPQGTYRLAAKVPGIGRKVLEGIKVNSGKATTADVKVVYGATITGRIEMVEGDVDVTKVVAILMPLGGRELPPGETGEVALSADGSYSYAGVEEGSYTIYFVSPVFVPGLGRQFIHISVYENYEEGSVFYDGPPCFGGIPLEGITAKDALNNRAFDQGVHKAKPRKNQ